MVEGILKDPNGVHMDIKEPSSSSRNNKKKNSFKKSNQEKEIAKVRASVSFMARRAYERKNALTT